MPEEFAQAVMEGETVNRGRQRAESSGRISCSVSVVVATIGGWEQQWGLTLQSDSSYYRKKERGELDRRADYIL